MSKGHGELGKVKVTEVSLLQEGHHHENKSNHADDADPGEPSSDRDPALKSLFSLPVCSLAGEPPCAGFPVTGQRHMCLAQWSCHHGGT